MREDAFKVQNTSYTQYKVLKNWVRVDYYVKLYEELCGEVHFSIKNQESQINEQ